MILFNKAWIILFELLICKKISFKNQGIYKNRVSFHKAMKKLEELKLIRKVGVACSGKPNIYELSEKGFVISNILAKLHDKYKDNAIVVEYEL